MYRSTVFAVTLVAATATLAESQITRRPPIARPQVTAIVSPDVPLLIGFNSGDVVQIDDMNGAGAQLLDSGFWQGKTSAAPVIGKGINGRLIALVPGDYPKGQILLPNPGWEMLDSKTGPLVSFMIDPASSVLYGVNCQSAIVVRYDMANRVSQIIGSKGTGVGQLECPERIAVDAQGRIYVSDLHRVVRMNDITGNGWTAFGSHGSGEGQFNYIRGLAVDRKGRIYISDSNNRRVIRMDDVSGAGWTSYSTGQYDPEGVAVDSFDRIYVALPVANRILRLDDISGAGLKTFTISRDAGYAGPKVIVPMKRAGGGGGVIR